MANGGEVADKALTLKFGLPSNSGPVDICTFLFMALICGQIFQKGNFHVGLPRRRCFKA